MLTYLAKSENVQIGLEPLLQSLRSLRPLERLVKDKKRIFFVPVSHVLWIEATGNYACIRTASDSQLLRKTRARLEEKLALHHFIRVRKSALMNSAALARFVRCSMEFTTSYWLKERWSRRAADTLTSYELGSTGLGNWDVKLPLTILADTNRTPSAWAPRPNL